MKVIEGSQVTVLHKLTVKNSAINTAKGTQGIEYFDHSTHLVQSRSFNKFWILVKLKLGLVWQRARNTQNNFGKSIRQLREIHESILTHPCYLFVSLTSPTNEIHALILTNPCNNFDKSMSKLQQIQQFNSTIARRGCPASSLAKVTSIKS